jgi:hypothetical protein
MNRKLPRVFLLLIILLVCVLEAQQGPKQPSAPGRAPASKALLPEPGAITNGVYRNASFGFTYMIPFGWVDRTEDMRDASDDAKKSRVLLEIFERPPEASGEAVNSAVVIAAESVSSYAGLTNAAQYFGPLTEVATTRGFQAINEPYEFPVDGKSIVRRDFSKQRGSVTMHQSSLALLAKGYIVSFTFIGGSDDEVTELIEKLRFGLPRKAAPPKR